MQKIRILQKENQILKKQIEKLRDLVTIDFLTKVYNRRAFSAILKSACREVRWMQKHFSRRQKREQFSLLLIDLDDFKKLNDKFGHLYGDKILKKTAHLLKGSVRDFDIVSRWGGEEFTIILRETTLEQGKKKAELILNKARKTLPVTFSIGIIHSDTSYTDKKIFEKVDKAMYRAKKQGKNQVVVA
jgi:diguanylate cyclase (GGDEF)-like protein